MPEKAQVKKPRGFAAMDPERRKALGRKGGKVAQGNGTAHRFTSEEAVKAATILHETGKGSPWTQEEAIEACRKSIESRTKVKPNETGDDAVPSQPT
jgi:general stress protein YciG